jgi:hypothetical protein
MSGFVRGKDGRMLRPRFPLGLLLLGSLWALGSGTSAAQDQAPSPQPKARAPAAQASASAAPVLDSLNPRMLGTTEALLDYCTKADPKGAAKVRARLKEMVKGASSETLAQARKSDEYRKARSAMEDFAAKIDPHNASRACSGPVAARNREQK